MSTSATITACPSSIALGNGACVGGRGGASVGLRTLGMIVLSGALLLLAAVGQAGVAHAETVTF